MENPEPVKGAGLFGFLKTLFNKGSRGAVETFDDMQDPGSFGGAAGIW